MQRCFTSLQETLALEILGSLSDLLSSQTFGFWLGACACHWCDFEHNLGNKTWKLLQSPFLQNLKQSFSCLELEKCECRSPSLKILFPMEATRPLSTCPSWDRRFACSKRLTQKDLTKKDLRKEKQKEKKQSRRHLPKKTYEDILRRILAKIISSKKGQQRSSQDMGRRLAPKAPPLQEHLSLHPYWFQFVSCTSKSSGHRNPPKALASSSFSRMHWGLKQIRRKAEHALWTQPDFETFWNQNYSKSRRKNMKNRRTLEKSFSF